MRIALLLLLTILISGCQNTQSPNTLGSVTQKRVKTNVTIADNSNYTLITQDPWSFIQNQLQIKIPDNKRIMIEKDKIIKNKNSFETNILRSEPYIYYIVNQLNERNMPVELALIPLIESAYDPLATSYAKAAGLWQIVPITAKQYGLTKNNWYDPRRDLIESTDTAINLLQYLNQRFDGDWLLTLAAYNAGEGRVQKAITWNKSKGLPTNFWALNLPKETMQYVPKFLAITNIIRHNDQYRISLPNCVYANSLVKFDLSEQISLDKIADYAGISLDELLEYNAAYTKKVVKGPYHLFIPANYAPALYTKLSASHLVSSDIIDLLQVQPNTIETKYTNADPNLTNNKYVKITDREINYYEKEHKRYSQIIYRVKSGDNLYLIAKNHKVSVSDLLQWNKIQNSNKLKPGEKLTINIKNGSS
ncbi:membrane-bound lytic murein transglycosylase D [Orbus hercynius]|uniref:Membrane-bound lytic murein transglycosylase D n=1 Tax=Orbus hercynius TaxID=593135 RepID=A0A495RKB5_9GAMM|nr:transglycosylase SLT domain-containing protein [Orbus hercynius]RKS87754.1 membrane-bound lytic murein transglycosylase D [Orbus hercynius]